MGLTTDNLTNYYLRSTLKDQSTMSFPNNLTFLLENFQRERVGGFVPSFRALHFRLEPLFEAGRLGRDGLRPPDEVLLRRFAVPEVQGEDGRDAGTSQKHLQDLLLQSKSLEALNY